MLLPCARCVAKRTRGESDASLFESRDPREVIAHLGFQIIHRIAVAPRPLREANVELVACETPAQRELPGIVGQNVLMAHPM
jgi:hypothetical protein